MSGRPDMVDSSPGDDIKSRLHKLEEASASSAIEGIPMTEEEMNYLRIMILEGKTDDEMVKAIKEDMNLQS